MRDEVRKRERELQDQVGSPKPQPGLEVQGMKPFFFAGGGGGGAEGDYFWTVAIDSSSMFSRIE